MAHTHPESPQQFDYRAAPHEIDMAPQVIAEIDVLLQSFIDDEKASSIAVFAAKDGKVMYYDAFGWKDIDNKIPASVDDYYVLFSNQGGGDGGVYDACRAGAGGD